MRWFPIFVLTVLWVHLAEAQTEPVSGEQAAPSTPTLPSVEEPLEDQEGNQWVGPNLSAKFVVASTYVFRGVLINPTPVTPSFQPSLTLDFGDLVPGSLSIGIWSAFAMANRKEALRNRAANEIDITLLYENTIAQGWLEIGGGFGYYFYPGAETVDGEKEFLLSLGIGNLPVTLGVIAYLKVHPGIGFVLEPRVGWSRNTGDFRFGFDMVLGTSFNQENGANFDHTTITASLDHSTGGLCFGLGLSYTLQIAPPGLDFLDRSLLYGFVSLSIE